MPRDIKEDMRKLTIAFFENLGFSWWNESLGLDGKRPFGNSDFVGDILKIIGWQYEDEDEYGKCASQEQTDYAVDLYKNHLLKHIVKIGAKHFNMKVVKTKYGRKFVDAAEFEKEPAAATKTKKLNKEAK